MERKTWRVNGEARMLMNGIEVCGPDAEYLAAYEDSGLTPKEVAKLVSPEMTKVARLLLDMLESDTAQHMAELLRAVKEEWQPSCWIPVTERLPEVPGGYIVHTRWAEASTVITYYGKRKNGEQLWCDADGNYYNVTHWMPLPEPPKESEQ